jgi:hypothetical protein
MKRNIFLLAIAVIPLLLIISCRKKNYSADVHTHNLQEHFDINNKHSILYIERPGNLDCIFPWASFVQFGRYDLTDVQSGTIRLKTGIQQHGTYIYDSDLGDATEFDFDKILLGWTNEDDVTHLQITTAPVTTVVDTLTGDTIKLFDVEAGVTFQLQNWAAMNSPESVTFSLWGARTVSGVTDYIAILRSPTSVHAEKQVFSINFIKSAFSGLSSVEKHNLAWVDNNVDTTQFDIDLTATTDTRFEAIVSECSKNVFDYRLKLKNNFAPDDNFELAYVDSCAENMRLYLGDVLLSYTMNGRPRRYPTAQSSLDSAMVLYTNINETIHAAEILGKDADKVVYYNVWNPIGAIVCLVRATSGSSNDRLNDYLQTLINSDVGSFSPGAFSKLVLKHTDYLLYAGITCLFDTDFNSRYFNFLDGIITELHNLLSSIHGVFHDNNIVIRFYAVASLYDFIKGQDRGFYGKFEQYYATKVDSDGEYGEGMAYLDYVNSVVLPVLYLATQERYTWGAKMGQLWLERTAPGVQLCIRNSESLLGIADKWGEIPAIDDGFNLTPWLAPVAVIASNSKFLDYTQKIEDLQSTNPFAPALIGAFGIPNSTFRLLTYPFNKTYSQNNIFNHSDSAVVCGNIVKLHTSNTAGTYSDEISLTLIAEDNPEHGSTHDQIDHGAIQLNRMVNRGANNVHVSHLIIDPGYPGFQEDKRNITEWQFQNQNVLMMYNMDIATLDDSLKAGVEVRINDGEHDITYDDPFNPQRYAGMSGYRYMSQSDIADMIRESGIFTDTRIMSSIAAGKSGFSLKGDGGGQSEVIRKFRNGVQTRIRYEYRLPHIQYYPASGAIPEHYSVTFETKKDCNGLREVYQLGNSFYVIDRFPQSERSINNIAFASSWNLPENTDSVPGRPGCFEGFLSNGGTVQSRLQIYGKSFTATPTLTDTSFQLTQEFFNRNRRFPVTQLKFDNDLSVTDFMVYCITVIDGSESFRTISNETYTTANGITIWVREYTDGSSQQVIFNPSNNSHTVTGITSDAYIWIIDYASTVSGSARLFGLTTVNAGTHTIIRNQGGQCDINL